ncbi:AAA family ATPase [Azospira inquinata]|uniref:AAA family ATPase n=1 Tax=Azospira inquinata TaxID=2785627 RepID=A0A975SKU3_9RHOO|nr:AAA family ATPase [Azospira inquinata]QWT46488.1 AAA family ATPase [Azospira inquinata]QWT48187.1 AAA family ATPase [Azospira inquinata]
MKPGLPFADLPALATYLRGELENKKAILLYAYNGTGKTRLSMAFKDAGKKTIHRDLTTEDNTEQPLVIAETVGDTLYFNAFTEDLFHWDNDLDGDSDRRLTLNAASRFFAGLAELEMDNRIRPLLQRYGDFDFRIDTQEWAVHFSRTEEGQVIDNIKVSRGEENIFVWCFFLAIVQLALDGAEAYRWVKYVYIDDPISSLDEHNAIAVANHLAQLLKQPDNNLKTVISTHHTLFFNVLCNEFKGKAFRYFLRNAPSGSYSLVDTSATPFLHHLASIVELDTAQKSGALYTHHFNMMRRVMEQTSIFLGLNDWTECIRVAGDLDETLSKRMIDLMSHGDYSLYEPREMMEENKAHFRKIFRAFLNRYPFNPELFPAAAEEEPA